MSGHNITGSEVRSRLAPGVGSMRLYPTRKAGGGLLHTAASFAVLFALGFLVLALVGKFG